MTNWTVKLYGLGGLLSEARISGSEFSMTYGQAIRAAGLEDTPIGGGDRIEITAHDDVG